MNLWKRSFTEFDGKVHCVTYYTDWGTQEDQKKEFGNIYIEAKNAKEGKDAKGMDAKTRMQKSLAAFNH